MLELVLAQDLGEGTEDLVAVVQLALVLLAQVLEIAAPGVCMSGHAWGVEDRVWMCTVWGELM